MPTGAQMNMSDGVLGLRLLEETHVISYANHLECSRGEKEHMRTGGHVELEFW